MHHIISSTEQASYAKLLLECEAILMFLLNNPIYFEHISTDKHNFNTELSLAFVNMQSITKLNNQYRQINKATDVLSFNQDEVFENNYLLGDIIICPDYANKEAIKKNKTLLSEIQLLCVHGFLHLLGYDHATAAEEKHMFALQDQLLKDYLHFKQL